jgi:hypothetical protein
MSGMDKNSFEDRISWDGESFCQLALLNPEHSGAAMWRRMIEREAEKLSEAMREGVADDARRTGNRRRP